MKDIELIKKGFNAGYLLQKHDPELADKLLRGLRNQDIPYAQGYKAGIKEYRREQLKALHQNHPSKHSPKRNIGKER